MPRIRGRVLAGLAVGMLALAAPVRAVPGQWTLIGITLWAPAPAGGTGEPVNLFALRIQAEGSGFGGASLELPGGTKVSDIDRLSFDSYYETGGCGAGSPRFQLAIDRNGDGTRDKNVFVYAGPYPNFAGCPLGVWSHNDLLDGALRFDSTQLGGPFYGSQAQANTVAGQDHQVLRATVVWDSTFAFSGPSITWLDNVRVNDFLLNEPVIGDACSIAVGATGGPVCP